MIVGVDVRNVGLHGRRKSVGLERCAAGVWVAMAGCNSTSGRLADREVCKTDVGLAIARDCGRRVSTGNTSVVILSFENVKAARTDVTHAEQNVGRQLAFDREVPLINGGNLVIAAGVVADSDLVERGNIGKVGGRGEWIRELRITGGLRSAAIKSRLRGCLSTEWIAERTRAGGSSRGTIASGGKNKLRTEGPFVHKAVAEHAH